MGNSGGTNSNRDTTFTRISSGGGGGCVSGSESSTESAPFFGVEMVILAENALLSAAMLPPEHGHEQQYSTATDSECASTEDSVSTTGEDSQMDSVAVLASQLSQSQQLIDLSLHAVWGRRHRLPLVLLCSPGESGPSLAAIALLRHASLTVLPRPLSRQVTEHKLSIVLRVIEDNRQSLMLARRAHQLDRVLRAMLKEQVQQAGGGGSGETPAPAPAAADSGRRGKLTTNADELRLFSG